VTDRRVRNLVMLTVLLVWAVYLLASVIRGEAPEKWTWGIAPGVYAALYRPGLGKAKPKHDREDEDDEPERRPARRRRPTPAGDEE
jgi:hypothetical protein